VETENVEIPVTKKRMAVRELNNKHQLTRAFFFSQSRFRWRFGVMFPMGLCAGLVQVWWSELRKGNDAIVSLRNATPNLVRDVVLSQARSIYLKEFPDSDSGLTDAELDLLTFKYGANTLAEINSLQKLFDVETALEMDLVLQHGAKVAEKREFTYFCRDVGSALTQSGEAGLRVLLTRYAASGEGRGETGHRSGLVIHDDGSCRYYDPNRGEMSFATTDHFEAWFAEYFVLSGWDVFAQRGYSESPPIRIFRFGESVSLDAREKSEAIKRRIWESDWDTARSIGACHVTGP
jgi:hypothetical protein